MRHASPEEYERQLARDREEIGATIDAIGARLSPGQLLDQALGYAKTGGREVVGSVGRSARENPWPLVLTGVGLAWLVQSTAASRRSGINGHGHEPDLHPTTEADYVPPDYADHVAQDHRAARATAAGAAVQRHPGEEDDAFSHRVTEAKAKAMELSRDAGETAEAFRERVDRAIDQAREAAADLADRAKAGVRHGAEAVAHGAAEVGRRASDAQSRVKSGLSRGAGAVAHGAASVGVGAAKAQARAKDFYASQPLIVGAVGLAVGLLLGALLPTTDAENRAFGRYGSRLRRSAADAASSAKDAAKEAAAESVHTAARVAKEAVGGSEKKGAPAS